MIRFVETARYGYMATWYRAVAEHLVFAVQYIVHSAVKGEIAEFGCQSGRTATVISAAMNEMRADKNLHLFDSFEGMPKSVHECDLENEHVKSGVWDKGALRGISPSQLRRKCRRYLPDASIKIHEGWFSKTLYQIPEGTNFSMLHLDCDLYLSTFEVLDFLFKRRSVCEGAILLFDDWDCNRASNAHGQRKAWQDISQKYQIAAADAGGYGPACHKFIIQSYSSI